VLLVFGVRQKSRNFLGAVVLDPISRIMCSLLFNVVLTLENQARLKIVGAGRVAECNRGVDGGLAAGSIFAAHLGHRCPW
jgi:hypothetical protein